MRNRFLRWVLIVLAIVAVIVASLYVKAHFFSPKRSAEITQPVVPRVIPPKPPHRDAVPPPPVPEKVREVEVQSPEGLACLKKQADELAATRASRIAAVEGKLNKLLEKKRITLKEGLALMDYVRENPDGDHLDTVTKDGTTTTTVVWDVQEKVPHLAKPLSYELACKCTERVMVTLTPPPKPKKQAVAKAQRHVVVSPPKPVSHGECFAMKVDGRRVFGQSRLVFDLSFYGVDWRKLAVDPCFNGVDDETGEHLSLLHTCYTCNGEWSRGRHVELVWPPDVEPGTKTEAVFTPVGKGGVIGCPSGHCTVYVPKWLIASTRFCFPAPAYGIGRDPLSRRRVKYDEYFSTITSGELATAQKRGNEFPEVIMPTGMLR